MSMVFWSCLLVLDGQLALGWWRSGSPV